MAFFVSSVEPGSPADRAGLKPGDEIGRLNGWSLEAALMSDLVRLLRHQLVISLAVKRSLSCLPLSSESPPKVGWSEVGCLPLRSGAAASDPEDWGDASSVPLYPVRPEELLERLHQASIDASPPRLSRRPEEEATPQLHSAATTLGRSDRAEVSDGSSTSTTISNHSSLKSAELLPSDFKVSRLLDGEVFESRHPRASSSSQTCQAFPLC